MRQRKDDSQEVIQVSQAVQRHGLQFDLDSVAKSIHDGIPSVSSEMIYRQQLDLNSRVYIIMMCFGILLLLYVALFV